MTRKHRTPTTSLVNSALRSLAADSGHDFSFIITGGGTISFANRRILSSTHHRSDGLKGKPFSQLIRKPDGKQLSPAFLQPGPGSNPKRMKFSLLTRTGGAVQCQGKVYYFAGTGTDPAGMLVVGNRVRSRTTSSADIIAQRTHAVALLGSLRDGLCVVDAKGTIVSANSSIAGMARLHSDEMIGVPFPYPWLGKNENLRLSAALAGVVRTGMPAHLLVVLEREDDRPIALSFSISPLGGGLDGLFLASVRDISDVHPVQANQMPEKRIERLKQQVQRNAVRLKTLQDINSSVLRCGSLRTIFRRITEGVGALVDHDLAGIYIFDGDDKHLRPEAVSELSPFSRRLGKFPLTLGEGIVGMSAVTGDTALVNNAQHDPRSVYPPGMKPEIEHIVAAPLKGRQSTYGILAVARNRNPGFHEEDAQVIQSFADAASIAIENLRLYADLGLTAGMSRRDGKGFRSPGDLDRTLAGAQTGVRLTGPATPADPGPPRTEPDEVHTD